LIVERKSGGRGGEENDTFGSVEKGQTGEEQKRGRKRSLSPRPRRGKRKGKKRKL